MEAASGGPSIEPPEENSMEDTKRNLSPERAKGKNGMTGQLTGDAKREPPFPSVGEDLTRVKVGIPIV